MKLGSWVLTEITKAEERSAETSKIAGNSYGAGYEAGRLEAMQDVLKHLPAQAAAYDVVDD